MEITCKEYNPHVKPCLYYITGGFCSLKTKFRCEEYVKRKEPGSLPIKSSSNPSSNSTQDTEHISYSQILQWSTCRLKWQLSQEYELVEKPPAMFAGDLMHQVLSRINTGQEYQDILQPYFEPENPYYLTANYIYELAVVYKELYSETVTNGEAEREFHLPLQTSLGTYELVGIIDYLTKDTIFEFKYSESPEFYHKLFSIKDQLTCYFLATSANKATVITIRNPALRPKKDETVDGILERFREGLKARGHYFSQMSYYRNELKLNEFLSNARSIMEEIIKAKKGELAIYPTINKMTCMKCEFLNYCETGCINPEIYKTKEEEKL